MKIAFSHVGLVVSDIERSLNFYRSVLALQVLERYPDTGRGLEVAFLGIGEGNLELLCYTDPAKGPPQTRGRFDHLAWFVEDMEAAMRDLSQKGATFRPDDPVTVLDGRQIAYITGPDGERIELVQKAQGRT